MASNTRTYNIEKQKYMMFLHSGSDGQSGQMHEMSTTPLFSLEAKHAAEPAGKPNSVFPQYGLLGFNVDDASVIGPNEPILLNTNAPNSTFICGSQGSGKSYTLAIMLESLLRPKKAPGNAGNPVACVAFHYDVDSSGSVAEVAHLASLGIQVDVLVSESNERALQSAYTKELKGASSNLRVRPLKLRSKDLSVATINKLMAFTEPDGKVPLYMEVVHRILREMAVARQGGPFSYEIFRKKLELESKKFTREQSNPMNLRLQLLESFLIPEAHKKKDKAGLFSLQPGTLTVIDLSDTFIDATTACVLFDICVSLIKENAPPSGLVLTLDEAHKFMNKSAAATTFTESLLTTIREQRHNGTRVIVSTQEPTLSTKLLDLCSVSIIHRFSSPAWFNALKGHLGGASSLIADDAVHGHLMNDIMNLSTGESFLFSPSSYLCVDDNQAQKLGSGYLRMKTRLRIGEDGGQSKMAGKVPAAGVNGIVNGLAAATLS